METVYLYDGESKLLRQARCQTLQISNNKEKELIKVNGNGIVIIIQDTSISACTAKDDGRLVIETKAGRKIVFLHTSEKGTLKLLARLNKVLENSNCDLRFEEPQSEEFNQILQDLESNKLQQKNSRTDTVVLPLIGMAIISIFMIIATTVGNQSSKEDPTESPPVAEDAWEARLKREQEEWDKKQEAERVERQSKTPNSVSSTNSEGSERTKISAIILSVACAAKTGFIPRSQMGINIKKMLSEGGYDPADVYGNWDYYWERAQEIDKVAKSFCIT
jgi:uncharacterized protein YlxW (UPF0749 family)